MGPSRPRVIVVGAGAAGLAAAAEAALAGATVALLEKNARPGLKMLISGGGHCNVTTSLGPREAEPLFGRAGGRFLRHALYAVGPSVVRAWLAERGVATYEAELEKVWPVSMRAADVVGALVGRARDAGVDLRLDSAVSGVCADGARWAVRVGAVRHPADAVVLAAGGLSYPKTGTVGDGFDWLAGLGVRLTPRRPALAPLRSRAQWVRSLAGLTLDGVEVQLREPGGRIAYRRRRPLLFTHTGVSGPGAMDCSGRIERDPGRYQLHVDLLPDSDTGELHRTLFAGRGRIVAGLRRLSVPRRLAVHIAADHGLEHVPPAQVSATDRRRLVAALRGLEIPVEGSTGFAHAEVTTGGVALDEVDPKTMALRRFPGLFVTGELLDVDGPIGGFSFLQAFGTGALAGRAAARYRNPASS